ncbi:metal ABC transporter substrate-binding protein [Herbidospora sp. NBRC 101105]|uniref:metal ABC transporter substrate-binding protein n=1 Tax=Herbidospora sp. NBRC 101105 TaxID=3032195 RepID=UPI002553A822|nr:metal ABC transporter substrate-binding protein [Herbidospora sp. NBRC 101105]
MPGNVVRFIAGSALVLTAACGGSTAAETGKPVVDAAFFPLQWLAEKVGGPDVTVEGLTKPGVEPHDLELTPQQVAGVAEASLVVYVKGVQPAVDEAVAQHAADRGFDAASAVPTLAAVHDEHAEEEEHGHEEEELAYDPHLWLDPSRMATLANALGGRLAEADPAHGAAYKERAKQTAAALTTLDAEFAKGLETCANRTIVTAHTAFGYLANRYKLEQVGIGGIDPDAEPSPARLAEAARIAKEKKVTTIFTEELVSPKVAEVLASEVGAKTAVLNPLESPPQGGDYVSGMTANLTALRTALGCQ